MVLHNNDPNFLVPSLEKTRLENAHFLLWNHHPKNYVDKVRDIYKNKDFSVGLVQNLFFSRENVDLVQKQIVMKVFYDTNKRFKIPFQDPQAIKVVMLSIFNEYGRNLPTNITEQIRELNKRVCDSVVPYIITELEQKADYIKEIHQPFQTIDRPLNMSSRGNRSLPSVMRRIEQ